MRLSVVTCLHAPGNRYIGDAARSLAAQTLQGFEWVILENHGGSVGCAPELVAPSFARVRLHRAPADLEGIGALKRHANLLARGELLVELDADDLLAPDALEQTLDAFERGADVVYSDFAEFKDEGEGEWVARWDDYPYGGAFGWEHYPVVLEGRGQFCAMRAPLATAHNLRRIEWAPNHLRAWTRDAYEKVGGHDRGLAVADDHDLMVRFYLAGARFAHVPQCLYFYRVHGGNTVTKQNAAIQDATAHVYNERLWALAEKWTDDQKLLKVDLCGGLDAPDGYLVLDRSVPEGRPGIAGDLDERWRLADSSVGLLRAHDAIEHLRDPVHTMNEAFRVLAPGGFLLISVPSTSGAGAFCDPTHVSFWNRLSFRYYTSAQFSRYVPDFVGRFQASRVIEWFPSDWHKSENVPYVEAHLFCVKDGFRAMGEWLW
jgi:O-antigen biosynthesis protein